MLILDEPTIGLDPIARRAVWEQLRQARRAGETTVLLTTARAALVTGKALAASIRGLMQGLIVAVLAALLGVPLRLDPAAMAGTIVVVVIGSAVFSTFSLSIACLVKTRERFHGDRPGLDDAPLFRQQRDLPDCVMPAWLRMIARVNPLTYLVDALRR